ncbi:hypothetical protein AYO44_03590 [Planctomycetaceae bacterium SCGC AG-212-F19]|nr:hypothetical protein AYO44_03590 [Planctomycetaceae bacterium SCGC AG-212-F19]
MHMLLALVFIGLASYAPDPKDILAELAKLEGTWQAVAVEEDGKTRKIENGAKLVIKGDRGTFTRRNGESFEGVLDIDPQTKSLDLRDKEGKLAFRCLYRLDGEMLTLAIGDDDRPKDFTSSKTVSVATYKRMK